MKMDSLSLSSQEMLRILSDTGLVVFSVNSDGDIEDWGKNAEDLLGYSAGQVLGKNYEMLLTEAEVGQFRKMVDKVRRGRRVKPFQGLVRRQDGVEVYVRISNAPLEESEGQRVGRVAVVLQDINDQVVAQRALNDSVQQVRAIFQTVPDAIVIIDDQGIVESMNPAAETMFRHTAHEIIGRPVTAFMPQALQERMQGSLADAVQDNIGQLLGHTNEAEAVRRGGNPFPIELAVAKVSAEGRITYAGVARDITDRKQAEAQMQQLNVELEAEVDQRTRINNDLIHAMQELKSTQDQLVESEKLASLGGMVAGVAHEINTPLGVGITAASILKAHTDKVIDKIAAGEIDEKTFGKYATLANEAVNMLESNLNRAADLVKSFKQIAVDQSSSIRRTYNFAKVISEVTTSLHPKLRGTKLEVQVECPEDLVQYGNPGAVTQILTNFVMNSILHAYDEKEPGVLNISVAQNEDRIQLKFADDGKGMTEEQASKVFEPFFTTRRGSGGTGLGMHIVHNLVRVDMNGTIKVVSTPGFGTQFTIDMPLLQEPEVSA